MKEPEPTATLPALGGAANGLIGVARLAKARQQGDGNPSCLVSPKATIATSLSTSNAAPFAADARRHGAARGAARGGKPGVSRFVAQSRVHRVNRTIAGTAGHHKGRLTFVLDGFNAIFSLQQKQRMWDHQRAHLQHYSLSEQLLSTPVYPNGQ